MTARRGQVALYLVAVLVAICVLTMMNVGIYLSVTAKNRAMNAGDAAALAVANYQGELLNRIGQMNIDHLKAALEDDDEKCQEIMTSQLRCCFLGPISGKDGGNPSCLYGGLSAGNRLAKENGGGRRKGVEELLRDHALEVRQCYAPNPETYPAPWEGAWEEYALALELAANAGIWAGPDNITFVDAVDGHMLLDPQFYNAVGGQCWCWFKFNAAGLLDGYENFHSWPPLPWADGDTRLRRCVNSEIYSLHLRRRIGGAVDLLGTNLICRLTDASVEDIAGSALINDPSHAWMFYDQSVWRNWWEMDPSGGFPVVGDVKPEYDVLGCAALCRTDCAGANLAGDGDSGDSFGWTAGAKPFGTVVNEDGEVDVVTANRNFVTPAFTCSRLVPIDAVGGRNMMTADPDWMLHVRKHLPAYMERGPYAARAESCWYCRQLRTWEGRAFRSRGSRWLKYHSSECVRPRGGGSMSGGTAHGH